MTRRTLIQQILKVIYNGFPPDDSNISENLVNLWISEGTAIAAKQNYTDNIKLEGVGFVNNSFYTTFKNVPVTKDENFLWKATIPEVPVGIGTNEGLSRIRFKGENQVGIDAIPISARQSAYNLQMRPIPNKIIYYYEGNQLYAISPLLLDQYTISMTMISGGDATNLDSNLNVPSDYFPIITEWCKSQWQVEINNPVDTANDGQQQPAKA